MTKTVVIEEIQTVATENNQGDVEIVVVQPQPNTVVVSLPATSVVEVTQPAPAIVVVNTDDNNIVEVQHTIESTVVVEQTVPVLVEVMSSGPQGVQGVQGPEGPQGIQGVVGPQGPAGSGTTIGGYDVTMVGGQENDLLSFTGAVWTNRPQTQVTDGGNF